MDDAFEKMLRSEISCDFRIIALDPLSVISLMTKGASQGYSNAGMTMLAMMCISHGIR